MIDDQFQVEADLPDALGLIDDQQAGADKG